MIDMLYCNGCKYSKGEVGTRCFKCRRYADYNGKQDMNKPDKYVKKKNTP